MIGSNDRHPSKIDIKFRSISCFIKPNLFSPRKIPILKSINGEFKSGELTGIIGTSGAGKSTFLNIISGYEKNFYGNIYYNGEKQKFFGEKYQNLSSYIMQDGLLHDLLTVWESMEISARLNLDCSKQERDFRIQEILKTLSLEASRNTLTKKLSGGERRRLSIGVELIKNPPIFFLDEPTSGLDDVAAKKIISLLSNLAHEGRTIVCTIHQPSAVVLEKFDHLICLFDGECTYQGSVQKLLPFLEGLEPPLVCPNYHNPADFLLEVCHGVYGDYCRKLVQKTEEIYSQHCLISQHYKTASKTQKENAENGLDLSNKSRESSEIMLYQLSDNELPDEKPRLHSPEFMQKVDGNYSADLEKVNHGLKFSPNSAELETPLEIGKVGFQILQNHPSELPEEKPSPNSTRSMPNMDSAESERENTGNNKSFPRLQSNSAEASLEIDKKDFQILQHQCPKLPWENPSPISLRQLQNVDRNYFAESERENPDNGNGKSSPKFSANSAELETPLEVGKEDLQILRNHPSELSEENLSRYSQQLESPLEIDKRNPQTVQNKTSELPWEKPSPTSPILLKNIDRNESAESKCRGENPDNGYDKNSPRLSPNSAKLETLLEISKGDPQTDQNTPSALLQKKRSPNSPELMEKIDRNCSAELPEKGKYVNEEKSLGANSNCAETSLEVPDLVLRSAENEVGISSWGKIEDYERTSILLGRIYQIMLRDRQLTLTRIFSNLILSLVVGIMFYQIGKDGKFTMDNLNYIFFTYIWIMYEACCTTAITFTEELPILKREYFNGWYSVKNYFFAITIAGVPIQLFTMTIFITISYFMTGQPAEAFRFAIFYLLCFLNCQVAQSFCTFMCVIAQVKTSVYLVLVAIFPFLTFCGFFVHVSDAPFFLQWAFDASFIRYAMEGAIHSIMGFDRGKLECSEIYCHFANTKTFIKQIGFEEQRILLDIFVLVGHFVVFKVAIYVALLFRIGGKK